MIINNKIESYNKIIELNLNKFPEQLFHHKLDNVGDTKGLESTLLDFEMSLDSSFYL